MAYYGRGDYYRGDYYRGDFFGSLKKIGGAIARVGGIVANPIAGAASLLGGSSPKKPSGAGAIGQLPVIGGLATGINKLAHGGKRPKKGEPGYRARRMNPLNVKALRRADRRAHSFLRISQSVVRHFTAKSPKGKGYVHFKAKRK